VVLVAAADVEHAAVDAADAAIGAAPTAGLLALAAVPTPMGCVRLSAPASAEEYAQVLYAALREADALGLTRVLAVAPPHDGVGAAVADRLARAAHGG
jgi:L-threonylcarbamoyladenylate synthase